MTDWSEEAILDALQTGEKADELKRDFGAALYEDLQREASAGAPPSFTESRREKIYILPGIMGSRLKVDRFFLDDLVWIDPFDLALGGVRKLRYAADDQIQPAGALSIAYLRMKLRLRRFGHQVEYLSYDWRKPPAVEAARLVAELTADGGDPATLVCHSMGGLVARGMAALDVGGTLFKRVVTIGTPNLGSFSPVQAFVLQHGFFSKLGEIDRVHGPDDIMHRYVRHFPGLVEMMPDPDMCDIDFFAGFDWPQSNVAPTRATLQAAFASKQALAAPDDRFRQIIGVGETTVVSARIANGRLAFSRTDDGDGTVPRTLSEMGGGAKYYTRGVHMWLCNLTHVIDGVHALVTTDSLAGNPDFTQTPPRPGAARESIPIPPPWTGGREGLAIPPPWTGGPDRDDPKRPATLRSILDAMHEGRADTLASTPAPTHSHSHSHSPARAVIADADAQTEGRADGPGGYVMRHVMEAGRSWRDTAEERAAIEASVAAGVSTQAESPERLRLYRKRIMDTLGGDAASAVPELEAMMEMGEGVRNEAGMGALFQERIIGTAEQFLSVDFLKRGKLALNPVCRIVFADSGEGYGTGFLVAPDVIITNNHVLPSKAYAAASAGQFEYERDERSRNSDDRIVELDPGRLFVTHKDLDFTIVALRKSASPPHRDYGFLPLIGAEGKIRISRPVNIVQHPEARRKEVVVRDSYLKQLPENNDMFAYYTGDTLPGSSGSPVANDRWEVVALHHSGVPDMDDQGYILTKSGIRWNNIADPDGKTIHWVANEGVRISRIMAQVDRELDAGFLSSEAHALLQSVVAVGEKAAKRGAFYWLGDQSRGVDTEEFGTVVRLPRNPEDPPVGEPFRDTTAEARGVTTKPKPSAEATLTMPLTIRVSLGDATSMQVIDPVGTNDFEPQERRLPDDYDDRPGYDPDFLGQRVAFPKATNAIRHDVATINGSQEVELRYETFSVMMSRSRRLAYVSGGNYDPDAPYHARRRNPWGYDPRLPRSLQAGNEHYRNNPLDRGHLFRAAEGAWGETSTAAQRASDDTFHWTNIAPQHEIFNQSHRDRELSIWGQIENHLIKQARAGRRMSTFNGPVLRPDDKKLYGLKVPRSYWKVAVMRDDRQLRCLAFVLGQERLLNRVESLSAGRFGVHQVKLRDLEALTGLDFCDLREADVFERSNLDEAMRLGAEYRAIHDLGDLYLG